VPSIWRQASTYSLKVARRPSRNNSIELTADDTWGVIVTPDGKAMPLQMY
jgi:hypothetical protein